MQRPTSAFVGASWAALLIGMVSYMIGLWQADPPKPGETAGMELAEKGFYLVLLLFGLFSAVAVQKAVRDQLEGIPVTSIFVGLSWVALASSLTLLSVGLWNADLVHSEKGFYAMSFVLALFAAVAVQKNIRDIAAFDRAARPAQRTPQQGPPAPTTPPARVP